MTIRLDQRHSRALTSRADHVNAGVARRQGSIDVVEHDGTIAARWTGQAFPGADLHTKRDLTRPCADR